jgi:enoyl-CoA hydratase/carnithine racemase
VKAVSYKFVILEKKGSIALITLNRPDRLNAIGPEMLTELGEACRRVEADGEILVVILTGAGDRAFSAGADIKDEKNHDPETVMETFQNDCFDSILSISKPIIAAVNGFCIGGGLEIALACDILIGSENAVFGLPQVSLGLVPGRGGSVLLGRLVGKARAMDIVLTAENFDAQNAYRMGLISRLVKPGELMSTAMGIAETITSMGPLAIKAAKQQLTSGLEMPLPYSLEFDRYRVFSLYRSQDATEAHRAFREKRKPDFKGM